MTVGFLYVNKQSSEKNSNSNLTTSALYGVTAVLFISIFLNIFLIVRNVRHTIYKRQNSKDVQKQQDQTQDQNTTTYDRVEDNAGYQELGQLSQPSHYDLLK
ncbi:uncharacterized protein LOC133189430 [Saccostrea echinata]|uniref:uncharacterized protein LOC133189430 n=1 Tax=Saccostrea echinata TaxID=191078 RepID=UPI002A817926|nr:uncharacterized protein LOC133189430 [Saccostrea echinata]